MNKAEKLLEQVSSKESISENVDKKLQAKKDMLKKMGLVPHKKGGALGSIGIWEIAIITGDVNLTQMKALMKDKDFMGFSMLKDEISVKFDLGM